MSRLREFGESAASALLERVGRGVSRVQERKPLPSDLLESDDAYLVVFDAPGATRSDVQARFVEGRVEVRIDRFRDFHEGFEMRFPGRGVALDGSASLPDDAAVDPESATATLADNGTLTVRVPKAAGGGTGTAAESVDVHADAGSEREDATNEADSADSTDAPDPSGDGDETADVDGEPTAAGADDDG